MLRPIIRLPDRLDTCLTSEYTINKISLSSDLSVIALCLFVLMICVSLINFFSHVRTISKQRIKRHGEGHRLQSVSNY